MSEAAQVDELVLLTTGAMRARWHPRAVVGMWAWEAVLALLVGWTVAALARAAFNGDPNGDGPLWTPGGRTLLDFLVHERHGVEAATSLTLVMLLVGAVAGLVPLGGLLTALAYVRRDRTSAGLVRSIGEGLRVFPAMALLLVVATMAEGLVVGVGIGASQLVEAWTHPGLGEARAEELQGLVLLLFVALASAIGVVHDLSRAAVVRFRVSGARGMELGTRAFRLAPAASWWSWTWRGLASLAPLFASAWASDELGGRGGFALVVLLVLHQSVVLARVALRASWLAKALRAVDSTLRRAAA